MDNMDLHSFAVMAYGESPYLEESIKSILGQTKSGSDIYITTSTPSDFIYNTALKYGIDLFINPQNAGIVSDWNFALSKCNTKYVTLVHQDDIYYPGYAKKTLQGMEQAHDAIIAFCDYKEITPDGIRENTLLLKIKRALLWPFLFKRKLKSRFTKKLILRFGCPICCPSVTFNLEMCKPTFDPNFNNNMDWDAWLRLSNEKGSFVYVKDRLLAHRIHEDSETTRQIAGNGRYEEDLRLFNRLWCKPVAKLLAKIYKKSYESNNV